MVAYSEDFVILACTISIQIKGVTEGQTPQRWLKSHIKKNCVKSKKNCHVFEMKDKYHEHQYCKLCLTVVNVCLYVYARLTMQQREKEFLMVLCVLMMNCGDNDPTVAA